MICMNIVHILFWGSSLVMIACHVTESDQGFDQRLVYRDNIVGSSSIHDS